MVRVVLQSARRRLSGHRRVGAGPLGSRTKAQVSAVADGAEGDQDPGRAGDRAANESPPPSRAWKTAPVAASAIVPAITRSIASTPEAMPTFSAGIAAIAAVDIGA